MIELNCLNFVAFTPNKLFAENVIVAQGNSAELGAKLGNDMFCKQSIIESLMFMRNSRFLTDIFESLFLVQRNWFNARHWNEL